MKKTKQIKSKAGVKVQDLFLNFRNFLKNLIHSRPKDNCNRDLLPINQDYFLNKDLPIYNFDFDSKLNYGIKSDNIFDYYDIIKNAKEIAFFPPMTGG